MATQLYPPPLTSKTDRALLTPITVSETQPPVSLDPEHGHRSLPVAVRKTIANARRVEVSALARRGYGGAEILEHLTKKGHLRADGKPWPLRTIYGDLRRLNARWRELAASNLASIKGRQLEECQTLRQGIYEATEEPDGEGRTKVDYLTRATAILKLQEREAKIIGSDAGVKTEVSGPGGSPLYQQRSDVLIIERVVRQDDPAARAIDVTEQKALPEVSADPDDDDAAGSLAVVRR